MKKITGKIVKHSAKITLEIMGFCVAAVLLIWMGLFWRLSLGPINVDFITKHLETGINTYAKGLEIDFGTTDLVWGGYKTPFELQVKNVQVFNTDNEPVLIIPRLGVVVSKRSLLMRSVVPKTVTLYNPAIRIIRTVSGEMHLNIVPDHETNDEIDNLSVDGGAEQARILQNIISALKEGTHKDNPLSAFEGLKIKNAKLIFEDQKKGAIWHIKESDLSILRGKGGVVGAVVGDVSLGTTTTNISANVFFQEQTGEMQVVSFVKHFNPAAFSKQADFLLPLDVIDSPLNGAMHFVLNRDLEVLRGLVQVKGKSGQFNLPDLYKEPVIFNQLSLKLPFDIEKKSAKLDNLFLTLTKDAAGPKVSITSDVILNDDNEVDVSVQAELKGGDFTIAHDYWPEKLTPTPRKWVLGHLSDGHVSRATLGLKLSFPKDDLKKTEVKHVSGEIDFENMTVDYFPPLEPVRKVDGRAYYNQKNFTLKIKKGNLKDMKLSNADILIDGFLDDKIKIDVDVDLSGSIQTGLYVLNSEPLKYPEQFNLNPENIEGQGDINVQLKFPLKSTLNINDVKVKTTAKMSDVIVKNAIEDMYLSAKTASLDVDNEGMVVKGAGHLAGTKIKFNWDEKFKEGADFKTRIEANLGLDKKILHRLGLPKALAFKQSIPTDLTYTALFDDKQTLFLHGDMTPISFDLDELDYSKVSGVKGKLDMYVDFKSNIPQRIKNLNIDMEGLKIQGSVDLKQEKGKTDWKKVTLSKLEMGHSSVAVEIDNEGLKGYKASIKGAVFDAQPFMALDDKGEKNAVRQRVTPLRLGVTVDKLIMGPQETLKKIEIFTKRNSWGLIDQFEMNGIAGQGQVYMRYLPTDNNKGHSFRFEADDAGSALRALDVTKSVKGGSLVVDGHHNPKGGSRDLIGKIQLSNFRLVEVPVLAKLLNAMSLVGIPELLSGKGIKFSRLKTNFAWEERFDQTTGQQTAKKMLLRKGRTSGASLGLNFSGVVDVLNENLDLKGTIVPVSGLNKVIGQIPIFGPILTGGSNAVFAATYTIKGPTNRPTTTVNPLAALAPGILRRIFFEGD